MAKAKIKVADTNLPVPQSDAQAEQMIAQLGVLRREHDASEERYKARLAVLKEAFANKEKVFEEAKRVIVEALGVWASRNRERLTGNKQKSVELPTGTISWTEGRYAVSHRGMTKENIVAAIQDRIEVLTAGIALAQRDERHVEAADQTAKVQILESFLRTKIEPDKPAMIKHREVAETVRGISVSRAEEEFGVEPLATQIREVA